MNRNVKLIAAAVAVTVAASSVFAASYYRDQFAFLAAATNSVFGAQSRAALTDAQAQSDRRSAEQLLDRLSSQPGGQPAATPAPLQPAPLSPVAFPAGAPAAPVAPPSTAAEPGPVRIAVAPPAATPPAATPPAATPIESAPAAPQLGAPAPAAQPSFVPTSDRQPAGDPRLAASPAPAPDLAPRRSVRAVYSRPVAWLAWCR